MRNWARRLAWLAWGLVVAGVLISPARAIDEPALASRWAADHASRARLVAGGVAFGLQTRVLAGVEIALDEGWKTYWRHPGASGVPPRFDWSRSDNLASATVLFPAPQRFTEADGDSIGYKKNVIFPVEVKPKDRARPVTLVLDLEYGACRDMCIPVQAELKLTIPSDAKSQPGGTRLLRAVERVPRVKASARDPKVAFVKVDLAGSKPQIVIEAAIPGGTTSADAFLEAPDGVWVPLAQRVPGAQAGKGRFVVDLSNGVDLAELKGKTIRLTLVSETGQSEATFVLE